MAIVDEHVTIFPEHRIDHIVQVIALLQSEGHPLPHPDTPSIVDITIDRHETLV
jgi:hypothetical protein